MSYNGGMSTSRPPTAPTAGTRAPRTDGDATRAQLLDTAGQVFAERGFADATSKEICSRAGANMAAVNYHFGSRDGLYEAVLVEAHHQLMRLEELAAIAGAPGDPRAKLRTVIERIVEQVSSPAAHWGVRVLIRELLTPTAAAPALVNRAIAPKARLMLGLVGEIIGLPVSHPAVQRSVLLVISPCIALLVGPRQVRQTVLPALGQHSAALAEDMARYALAGLDAIAAQYRAA